MEISLIEWLSGILLGFVLLLFGMAIITRLLASAREKPTGDKYLADLQLRTEGAKADTLQADMKRLGELYEPQLVEGWDDSLHPNPVAPLPDPFRRFPQDARIIVDVVFPGEYRIGWEYGKHIAIPGTPKYFPFWESLERANEWFADSFPEDVLEEEN